MVMFRSSSFLKRTVWRRAGRAGGGRRQCGVGGGERPAKRGESATSGRARQAAAFCAPGRRRWPSPLCSCRVPRGRWSLGGWAGGAAPGARQISHTARLLRLAATHTPPPGRAHAPMFIVAWREITSGDSGVSFVTSSDARSWTASAGLAAAMAQGSSRPRPPQCPGDHASHRGTGSPEGPLLSTLALAIARAKTPTASADGQARRA